MAVTPFKSSDNFNMAGFNEKITEADNTYVAKTGDSMSGALSMGNNKITDVASPTSAGDAANKGYVDGNIVTGSYIGTGQGGSGYKTSVEVPFNPTLFIVMGWTMYQFGNTSYNGNGIGLIFKNSNMINPNYGPSVLNGGGTSYENGKLSWWFDGLSAQDTHFVQFTVANKEYKWIVIK